MKKQVRPQQQRVAAAEVKLLKQQEQLWDTEKTISDLDTEIAELRKKMWPSLRTSPRIQPKDENAESSDGLSRGLGQCFKVAKPQERRFQKPGKTGAVKKYFVKLANNMPRSEFLRTARKLTKDAGGSMDLRAPSHVDDTPIQPEGNENMNFVQGLRLANSDSVVVGNPVSCATANLGAPHLNQRGLVGQQPLTWHSLHAHAPGTADPPHRRPCMTSGTGSKCPHAEALLSLSTSHGPIGCKQRCTIWPVRLSNRRGVVCAAGAPFFG